MSEAARAHLRSVLNPRSIAIIGASENPNKIGGRPLLFLSKFGYRGKVFPINPKRSEVQGFTAYPSMAALPESPEVAVIVVPGDLALQAVEECAQAGVRVAIVMASGFGETAVPEAQAQERRMVELGRAKGMRIIGPNSQGLANFGTGAVMSFSTMFLEAPPQDGPVAIVSQSGGMAVVPYGLLRSRDIGVRHVHATGNDCDVNVPELAAALAEEPDLRLLLLYLETIRDPEPFIEMARIARERGLPVVALKSGRTAAGQQAARSHTGALANEDRVVDAFFEQHGIWRAQNMADLVQASELYLKGWRPQGRRLVVISNSGAVCVLAADAATAAGMPMAQLNDDTRNTLGRHSAELCHHAKSGRHHSRVALQQQPVQRYPARARAGSGGRRIPDRHSRGRTRLRSSKASRAIQPRSPQPPANRSRLRRRSPASRRFSKPSACPCFPPRAMRSRHSINWRLIWSACRRPPPAVAKDHAEP